MTETVIVTERERELYRGAKEVVVRKTTMTGILSEFKLQMIKTMATTSLDCD